MSGTMGVELPSIDNGLPVPVFVHPKDKEGRICPLCHNILRQPMQTVCGHRLCETCLENLLEENPSARCPVGEEDCVILSKLENTVMPDFGGRKDLKKLEVYCMYSEYGCEEVMLWATWEAHLKKCKFAVQSCQFHQYGCTEIIKQKDLKSHSELCKYRPEKCSYCGTNIPKCQNETHLREECTKYTVACPYHCGTTGLNRRELDTHTENCSLKPLHCKYGCDFVGTQEKMIQHEKDCVTAHLDFLLLRNAHLEGDKSELERKLQSMENDRDMIKLKMRELASENAELKKKVDQVELGMQNVQKIVAGNTEKTHKLEHDVKSLVKKDDITAQGREFVSLQQAQKELENRLASIESRSGDSGFGSNSSGLSSEVNQHDRLLSLFNVRLAEVDLRLQMLETASYNGILMWKIRGYNRRKADARSGKTISLYSQPFYTSPHGYKMCARVYLNGDGIGKNTHLSLFFVVMKGDYDALLPWPFHQKVSLMLLDQVGKRHLQDTFRPDPASSSFQKPQNEMNVASGCPLFVAHTVLEADGTPYIRDETIFIKVVVDTGEIQDV